ncbi:MAG: hypothetical protein LBH42_08895 [Treponema sp.]|jgi:hypothetical protein|nr:hypothetical protein [Treponema sp.]
MNEHEPYVRIERLFVEIHSKQIKEWARNAGDHVSWTRQRNMPLYVSLEFINFLEKSEVKYLIRLHNGDYTAERAEMRDNDEEVELLHIKHRLRQLGYNSRSVRENWKSGHRPVYG